MAISTPIALLGDVGAEFGNSTKPASDSLVAYHNQVFGSGSINLLDFNGTGKPIIGVPTYSESNIGENSADVQVSISNSGGLANISFYFQYGTDSNFGTYSTTATKTVSATTTLTDTISGLSAGTTYYYRVVVFNNYCSDGSDPIVDSSNNGSFTTDSATCDVGAPNVDGSVFQNFGNCRITWTEPSPSPANGYNIYYEVNGGGFVFKTNVPDGTTQYDHACSDGDFSNGDDVQWKVVSECSNGVEGGSDTTNVTSITTC